MYGHEDTRRKNGSSHTLKHVFSNSALPPTDKRRSDLSKDKYTSPHPECASCRSSRTNSIPRAAQ
jgi:hypothetical protein